MNIKLV